MAYIYFNNNPKGRTAIDCVVRAISRVTDSDWESTYVNLCSVGLEEANMPSGNAVWAKYLRSMGFRRYSIPNTCPDCYTILDFCKDHSIGRFVVGTGEHVVAVVDGDYWDSWDSGYEAPQYYFTKEGHQ